MFAQRVTRYRPRARDRRVGLRTIVSARESFSQSASQRPDPQAGVASRDLTALRFAHRGHVDAAAADRAREVRLVYRLDLSPLFSRMHDAVRGLASIDPGSGALSVVDVPRNYAFSLRGHLRWEHGFERTAGTLVVNKNGLVRFDRDLDPRWSRSEAQDGA
jgi:hypothetical protein